MTIAFIGFGNVGAPLADHLQRAGHEVWLAAQDPASESVRRALARNPSLRVATPVDAVDAADVVFLATPFQVTAEVLAPVASHLLGKVLVDCTNPVGPGLSHGLRSTESGSVVVQRHAPGARVVKAFSIYGFENFDDNRFPDAGAPPAMLYCGDDREAKAIVHRLAAGLGWDPIDVGGLEQALHLEHLTLLWIRMVRMEGLSPHFVWAALRR
jgi:predicted dinucleotide-binding enzyme